jgi:hypothetical protein
MAWALTQSVRVTVDRRGRTLTVATVRWPFRSELREYPIDAVRDVVVTQTREEKATTYVVVLHIEGEELPQPLSRYGSSDRGRHDLVAATIKRFLGHDAAER